MFRKKAPVSWLVVGLGNPGAKYENTRHNVGFMTADALAGRNGEPIRRVKYHALTSEAVIGGQSVLLMKPTTFMNLSGQAVSEAARFYKIPADHVLVISDDVDLPLGKLRIRKSGSAGGHNGLKHIIQLAGHRPVPPAQDRRGRQAPPRLQHGRLGAGPVSGRGQKDHRQRPWPGPRTRWNVSSPMALTGP